MAYDAAGNRLTSKDPLGNISSREYDAFNRMVKSIDAAQPGRSD